MMNRFDYLLKQYRESCDKRRKDRILMRSRSEPNINGEGTTGYRFKHGPHKGQVAGHISVDHPNAKFD